MKIAYVVGLFPAPSQTFVANQILGVEKCGHDVAIFTTDRPAKGMRVAVEIGGLARHTRSICPPRNYIVRLFRVLGLLVMYGWRAPWVVARALNVFQNGHLAATLWLLHAALTLIRIGERKYDIVHAQFGPFGLYALKLIQIGAIDGALVTSFRGYDATKNLRANPRKYAELFRRGRLFLPVSESLARKLVEAGCDPSKIHVLHSGIDCAKFKYTEPRRTEKQPTRIVTIGRLVEKKGVTYGLRAVAQVMASGRAVVCDIVGDGPLRIELERLIEQFGVGTHVMLHDWKSHREIVAMMEASHILLAPSVTAGDGDEEGIPNVVKEAMAVGLPIVSTVHAGIPELVVDGESGFLVPERSVGDLAERIMYLCDHPEIWPQMSRAARRKVETEFDIGRLSMDLVALYAASIKQHGEHPPTSGYATPVATESAAIADLRSSRPHRSTQISQGN
ncbi:MAG TPA: glycosyltransferase [Anaerolineae bacterium]|nr:glycosyltransferase [Anaerolineae bacterium]